MLFTIIALVVLSYMSVKLYAWDLKNEFTGFGDFLKDWVGCFSKAELGQEFKLFGYELVEAFKAFLLPIKTLGTIALVVFSPILLFVVNILTALIKVHKRK
ncbi:hypothetical protein vB_AbaP_Acibel007_33 [Acinetobacter phage vB_AbaP_Acibel007]|uniref:Uncharacterized protein n=1 Tax=Acinetobacter phage vB_AbaP_Acibel007 TaxID=1481187 RepID=A0A075DXB7_9CAUD|nr:hypothetical protein vB_AbaP_Acibel007_33 [Acinetobacter phage vB_AbaP_Acibel007]AHY26804.1 hypothetical protein vB_AbaP_Acibel007_33 [Acinetobacter phage vB_AbaP_Acibel007]